MQLAFVRLTPAVRGNGHVGGYEQTTELWVNVAQVSQVGVSGGLTFVETRAGCSWVQETPQEVLALLADAINKVNGDWGDAE